LATQNQIKEAEAEYRRAITLDPRSASAWTNLGVLLAATNRPDEAITSLERALKSAPNHSLATANLGLLYLGRGDYARAGPLLERAASDPSKGQPDLALLMALNKVYLASARNDQARKLADRIEHLAAEDARVLYTLGLQFAEAHDYEKAADLFQQSNTLRPSTAEILYNLGVALYNLDKLDEGGQAFVAAANLNPRDPDPVYRLGLIASARGQTIEALGYWKQALDRRPNYADAAFMIAEELARNQRSDGAIEYYEKAI